MNSNKKLVRSSHEKMIAGVCSGIAEYFDIDVTIVRILFVVAAIAGGSSVLLYAILWLVMPQAHQAHLSAQSAVRSNLEDIKNQAQSLFTSNTANKEYRYDPHTGQPVQQSQVEQQPRFDPYTGEEIK